MLRGGRCRWVPRYPPTNSYGLTLLSQVRVCLLPSITYHMGNNLTLLPKYQHSLPKDKRGTSDLRNHHTPRSTTGAHVCKHCIGLSGEVSLAIGPTGYPNDSMGSNKTAFRVDNQYPRQPTMEGSCITANTTSVDVRSSASTRCAGVVAPPC